MKLAILFVDDDPNLLHGLQRMLRGLRADWEMSFAESGPQGLEQLSKQHFDVVVSDMRMPELDGAELLSEVERRFPGTMRVVLSGYAEEKSVFRSIGPAHQYLAKPCDPATITTLMERALGLRAILTDERLRDLAAGLRSLPSPPDLYLRITTAMQRDEVSTHDIAELVSSDVAMTAELLKVTNSAYFGLGSRMTTVAQAVKLLGVETVRSLVLYAGIFRQFEGRGGTERLQALSDYGLAIGNLAKSLAKRNGESGDRAAQTQCAGMLCAIGALVLFDSDPERYVGVVEAIDNDQMEAAERLAFGGSHCELGAYLLGLWGFAEPMVEAVLYALRPADCLAQGRTILSYVHLARSLGPAFPFLSPVAVEKGWLDVDYVARLGLKTV